MERGEGQMGNVGEAKKARRHKVSEITSSDYFVVGSSFVMRSIERRDETVANPFPLELQIVADDAGPVGAGEAELIDDDLCLDVVWRTDDRDHLPQPDRVQAWRLFAQVCAKLPPDGGLVRIRSSRRPPRELIPDGFRQEPSGDWVASKEELRRRKWDKFDSTDELYADPVKVPWNVEPRPRELLESLSAEASGPRNRVVDMGCGFGPNATALEERGLHVSGFDVSRNAIERCRRIVKYPDRFHVASAERLPFDDGAFDFALDIGCLHCLRPDLQEPALAEIARVLRAGGVLMSRVFKPRDRTWLDRQPLRLSAAGMDASALQGLLRPHFDISHLREGENVHIVRAVRRQPD